MEPLLSLCVPTYNRATLLSQALRAILSQITPDLTALVEVIILDNASPDDTPGVVARAQAEFPDAPVRYVRRPENIGADRNFLDAVAQARGEFVYLLSDDDVLLPGAVATLLQLIREHPDLDAFTLNVYEFWDSPDEERAGHFSGPDHVLAPQDEALPALNSLLIFLSCMAFRRANVAGRDYSDKVGTLVIQAFLFVDALSPGHGLYVTERPYLAKRTDNHQGYGFFEVFVTNFDRVMQYARQRGYSQAAVRQTSVGHLRFLCTCLLLFKHRGTIGTIRPDYADGLGRLWRVYGPQPFAALILTPMMLTPAPLFRGLHRTYQRLKALVRPGAAGHGPPPTPLGPPRSDAGAS